MINESNPISEEETMNDEKLDEIDREFYTEHGGEG